MDMTLILPIVLAVDDRIRASNASVGVVSGSG
jgi:hypothetical protein